MSEIANVGTTDALRLNIGAGDVDVPGFIAVDHKTGGEAYPLRLGHALKVGDAVVEKWEALPDACVDEIRAVHVLEHLGHTDSTAAVLEWGRVLKPGGTLKVAVPDFEYICKGYLEGRQEPFAGYLMGGQIDNDDFHRTVFDRDRLTTLMVEAGFDDIRDWHDGVNDCHKVPCSLNLQGTKRAGARGTADLLLKPFPRHRKFAAVMSMPRLAFSDNMFCALQALTPFGIGFAKVTGAYWGPCLTRGMEPHLNDGTDYIITLDYDTVFTAHDVHKLAVLMEEHPEADAICPVQCKREEATALFKPVHEETGEYFTETELSLAHFDKPLTRVAWGHFGLTFIRTSALRKLKTPWFHSQPDPEGRWGDNRVDDDIWFWGRLKDAGCRLYVANHIGVGHLQLVATWLDQEFCVHHQYIADYHKQGKPKGMR